MIHAHSSTKEKNCHLHRIFFPALAEIFCKRQKKILNRNRMRLVLLRIFFIQQILGRPSPRRGSMCRKPPSEVSR